MLLENRTVVVTGAAMGIGRAAALCCAEAGGRTVLADIDAPGLEETVRDIQAAGGKTTSRVVDVSVARQVEELMAGAVEDFGGIDALINCAGVLEGAYVPVDELDETVWQRVMDTNLKGSFLTSKYATAIMKEQKSGVIVLLSSGAGVRGGVHRWPTEPARGVSTVWRSYWRVNWPPLAFAYTRSAPVVSPPP